MFANKPLFLIVLGLLTFSQCFKFKTKLEYYITHFMPKVNDRDFELVDIMGKTDNTITVFVRLIPTLTSQEKINCTFQMGYKEYPDNDQYGFTFKWANCTPSIEEIDGGNLPVKHIDLKPNSTNAFHIWQLLIRKRSFINLLTISRQLKRDENDNQTVIYDRFTVQYDYLSSGCNDVAVCIVIVDKNQENKFRTRSETCRPYFIYNGV